MGMEKTVILTPVKVIDKPYRTTAGIEVVPQPDLLFMDSILVSTGENKNDDVFLPEEMWKARNTPRLKPVDWEHETGSEVSEEEFSKNPRQVVAGNQIIGVMYDTYVIDDANNTISEDKVEASDFKIPSSFHIVDQAVIYKGLYPKTAAKIEKGAKEGTLFVSMEAWFDNYDYLIGTRIVARNEETAFLDKNLRARGGNGMYGEVPVKRVLRNLVFGGKGIVFRPANENSVIKSVTHVPVQAQASEVYNQKAIASNIIGEINPQGNVIQKESVKMGDENKNLQPVVLAGLTVEDYKGAIAKAAQLEQTIKAKEDEVTSYKTKLEASEKAADGLKAALAKGGEALESVLAGIKAKLASAKPEEFFSVISGEVASVKAELEKATKELTEAKEKLAKAAQEALVASRRSKIAAELKVDGDKLEKLLASVSSMNDEAFASWLDVNKEILTSSQAAMDEKKKEEEKKKKEEEAKASASASGEEGITDPKILDQIKASAAPSGGVDNNNAGVDLKTAYAGLANALFNADKSE